MPRGLFITFEGGEGVGKSTQIALLADHLRQRGRTVLVLREPGSTRIGEQIRAIVLDPGNAEMDPRTELLLYEAARAQMVAQVVKPGLRQGAVVLCDRFNDSTMAYQGHARGLGHDTVAAADGVAVAGLVPDATVLLCRDTATALRQARLCSRETDRIEAEPDDFHESVSRAFDIIAAGDPQRVRRVVVTKGIEQTFADVLDALSDVLGPCLQPEAGADAGTAAPLEASR